MTCTSWTSVQSTIARSLTYMSVYDRRTTGTGSCGREDRMNGGHVERFLSYIAL